MLNTSPLARLRAGYGPARLRAGYGPARLRAEHGLRRHLPSCFVAAVVLSNTAAASAESSDKSVDAMHEKNKARIATFDLGEWTISSDLQVRPRFLADAGRDFAESDTANTRVTQRTRLGATVTHEDGWAGRVLIQDVRAWGEANNTLNDFSADGLDIQEAYIRIPMTDYLRLHIGRQEVNFDNQRILGAVGWAQRARALDGIRLVGTFGQGEAQVLYARLSQKALAFEPDATLPDDRESNSDFIAAHIGYKFGRWLNANASYYLVENRPADSSRHTIGTFLTGSASILLYTGEFYYQFGELGGGEESQTIDAFMAAFEGGFALPANLKLLGRFEYLSGSGTPQSAFDPFFGTNHKFYGEADYFLVLLGTAVGTGGNGLVDYGGKIAFNGVENLSLSASVHVFSTVEAIEVDGNDETFLGLEIDLKATYRFSPFLRITGVYAPIVPGEAMRLQNRVSDDSSMDLEIEHFGYVTLDLQI